MNKYYNLRFLDAIGNTATFKITKATAKSNAEVNLTMANILSNGILRENSVNLVSKESAEFIEITETAVTVN